MSLEINKTISGSFLDQNLIGKNYSRFRLGFRIKCNTLRKHLGVSKNLRKYQVDTLLKKCKNLFFKNIHTGIKKCLINFKLNKLPQTFITDLKIETNKNYMKMKIIEIYQELKILSSLENLNENNYIKEGFKDIFEEFVNLTCLEAYEIYLCSRQYLVDYNKIRIKFNDNFAIMFNYASRIFIQYFNLSKGNKLNRNKIRIRKIKLEIIKKRKILFKVENFDK